MKLSTSTNILFLRPHGVLYSPQKAVEEIVSAGFQTLDFNFYDWVITKGSPYMGPDGDAWLDEMAEQAKRLGVRYEQAHGHVFDFLSGQMTKEQYHWQQAQVLRSIKAAKRLGAEVVVLHPATCVSSEGCYQRISKEKNIRYFSGILEATKDIGIKIAIENMTDIDIAPGRKYCAVPDELVDLVDTLHDSRLGICWDFEHGALMQQNQPGILKYLGRRLFATHVSDQHGYYPVHLTHRLPMTGTLDWEPIIRSLKSIGYEGCFSYEAHNYLNALPDCAIEPALRMAYHIGTHLMQLGGEE